MASLLLDDFSGGLNLRDSPNQLRPNESPDTRNMVLTERGALKRRKGIVSAVSLPGVSGTQPYVHYSVALDQFLCARETSGAPNTLKLFTRPGDLSGSWTDRGTINSVVTARAGFVDFPGNPPKVVLCTNVNSGAVKGIFTWDGTTLTDLAAGDAVCGDGLALWQDRVYVVGYPTSDANGNPTLMRWCEPKDPTTWPSTNVQQFREKDAAPLTAIGGVAGGLIVFKKRSTYRVGDAAAGDYTTIDASVGCVNARAVAALYGRLYVWAADGIYECDGIGALRNIGDKIRPLYLDAATDLSTIRAGVFEDHVVFAGDISGIPFSGATRILVDYTPTHGAVVLHQPKLTIEFSTFASKEATLYGASADDDALYSMFTGTTGQDAGTAMSYHWKTPWLLPNSGMLSRLQRLRVQGLAGSSSDAAVVVAKDWGVSGALTYSLSGLISTNEQATADIQSLGHAAAFQLEIHGSAGGASTDFTLRAIQLIDTPLQWPSPGYPRGPGVRLPATPPPPSPPTD